MKKLTAKRLIDLGVSEEYFDVRLSQYTGSDKIREKVSVYCRKIRENLRTRGLPGDGALEAGVVEREGQAREQAQVRADRRTYQ